MAARHATRVAPRDAKAHAVKAVTAVAVKGAAVVVAAVAAVAVSVQTDPHRGNASGSTPTQARRASTLDRL